MIKRHFRCSSILLCLLFPIYIIILNKTLTLTLFIFNQIRSHVPAKIYPCGTLVMKPPQREVEGLSVSMTTSGPSGSGTVKIYQVYYYCQAQFQWAIAIAIELS